MHVVSPGTIRLAPSRQIILEGWHVDPDAGDPAGIDIDLIANTAIRYVFNRMMLADRGLLRQLGRVIRDDGGQS